jgi:inorganic pyrophosphatase/exopolyphosphatase
MNKTPIHLNAKHPADSLHDASRINYSKLYRVDHNLRVKDLGLVDINCIQKLLRYFEESSIKLTDDLKFKHDTQTLEKNNIGDIVDHDKLSEFPMTNPPKITVNDFGNQRPVLERSSSPTPSNDSLDIAEAYHCEQTETMFEFEP